MATSTFILRRLSLLRHHRYFSSRSAILSGGDSNVFFSRTKQRKSVLNLLQKETNPEKIVEICQDATRTPDYPLDHTFSFMAITKLRDANYFEEIRSFIEQLRRRPDLKTDEFASHSIVLYGRAGMLQNAITTFENLEESGIERSVKTLNALILACILAKKYDEARRVFVDFPERYGIRPDVSTYNRMIKAFSKSGSTTSGYSLVSDMEKAGLQPNATTFGIMIRGFYAEEKFEDVEKVLTMMKDRNLEPSCLAIFNIRITSLCKLRRSMEAKALMVSALASRKVNSSTYTYLIYGFLMEGNLEEAKKMFTSMVTRRIKPSPDCYPPLVYCLTRLGNYLTAFRFYEKIKSKNGVLDFATMKMLVEGLASVSKVDEARELIGQMKEKFPGKDEALKEIEDSLPA